MELTKTSISKTQISNIVMADTLPGDLVVTYQDAFQHFDTNQTGFIPTKQLGPLLRFCAENPSEAEIQVSLEIDIDIYHDLITLPICSDLYKSNSML